jgi:hypothetical protein
MKILKYATLILFAFLWFLGCSKTASKYAYDHHILQDDYRYGDLYRLANLPDFRVKVEKCDKNYNGKKSNVALYLAGDSFTEDGRVNGDNFATERYLRGFVAEPNQGFTLISGKKILIIETVERHFRERFQQPWKNWDMARGGKIVNELTSKEKLLEVKVPYNTQMHESLLFGFDFMMKISDYDSRIIDNFRGNEIVWLYSTLGQVKLESQLVESFFQRVFKYHSITKSISIYNRNELIK